MKFSGFILDFTLSVIVDFAELTQLAARNSLLFDRTDYLRRKAPQRIEAKQIEGGSSSRGRASV